MQASHNAGTPADPATLDDDADAFFAPGFGGFGAGSTVGGLAAGFTQVLYLTEAGDTTAISINDLHQGQIGDCFLISSIGEIALRHPAAIANMIKVNADGSETVTLYADKSGHVPGWGTSAFKPVQVTVSNVFPTYSVNNGGTQDVLGKLKEIWPAVLEKAVATLDGGYNAIANGGNPTIAMEELTGQKAVALSPAGLSLAQLQAYIAAGDLITMDTFASANLPNNLVGSHAYMLQSITTTNGAAMVNLRNPWGFDQPAAIAFSELSRGIAEVDVGRIG